jgi:predicted ATPase
VSPESGYRFKHALIQEAAYENLLKSRRQSLHRRVAEILRHHFADKAAAEPEALAHHFTQAGMTDAAIEWWGKAGDQALRRRRRYRISAKPSRWRTRPARARCTPPQQHPQASG